MIVTIICFLIVGLYFVYYFSKVIYRPFYGVWFICGALGSGKTCTASYYVDLLHKKRYRKNYSYFFSNVPLFGCTFDMDLIKNLTNNPNIYPEHSVIVLDEASICFNSRNFAKTKLDLIAYFKLCRHFKHRVILISQTFNDTDKQIRDLSTKVQICKPVIYSKVSMLVNCRPSFGVNPTSGDLQTVYKVGHIGKFIFLPKYYKKFNSFDTSLLNH